MTGNIFIDGIKCQFDQNPTILQVAEKNGVVIPKLCWSKVSGCGGRCMVCAVRVNGSEFFVPSCTTRCEDGMQVESAADEVMSFRRSAIELLLSEHSGDCEAPCHMVCPQRLDIPAMMRQIILRQPVDFNFNPAICAECGGRCEKACRRGRLDRPLQIRALLDKFALAGDKPAAENSPGSAYQHRSGLIKAEDIALFYGAGAEAEASSEKARAKRVFDALKNLSAAARQASATDTSDLPGEAERCLLCSCEAKDNCVLRDLAWEHGAKQQAFAGDKQPSVAPVIMGRLTFYPGKCVKCERCVELGKRINPGGGPTMSGRGFYSCVEGGFAGGRSAAFAGFEDQFIAECPVGALVYSLGHGKKPPD